jgi:hypothetical protein
VTGLGGTLGAPFLSHIEFVMFLLGSWCRSAALAVSFFVLITAASADEPPASLTLAGTTLDMRRVEVSGQAATQLRQGDQVLAAAPGVDSFDLLARAGNAGTEAIVVRARKEGSTYALVGRKGAPVEAWQYQPSRAWMRQPPVVEADGETLWIREAPQAPLSQDLETDSTAIVRWTPAEGWRVERMFRARPVIPQPRTFGAQQAAGIGCPQFERRETFVFGGRTLTVGESRSADLKQWVLASGCDVLIDSGPNRFDFLPARHFGDSLMTIFTAYNSGNGGWVDRYVLAEMPGQGLKLWDFPRSEAGPDNYVKAVAAATDYWFTTPAWPGMDGGVFRLAPASGYSFDGFWTFEPERRRSMPGPNEAADGNVVHGLLEREEVYRAFVAAAGPSFIGRAFALSARWNGSSMILDREWVPAGMVAFKNCEGTRHCDWFGHTMLGLYQWETRRFYFAFRQETGDSAVPTSRAPPAVWEFHPPIEQWPDDAAKAVRSRVDR